MNEMTPFWVTLILHIFVVSVCFYVLWGNVENRNEQIIEKWLQMKGYKYTPKLRNHSDIEILSRVRREFCIRVDGVEKIYTLFVDAAHQFDFVEKKE